MPHLRRKILHHRSISFIKWVVESEPFNDFKTGLSKIINNIPFVGKVTLNFFLFCLRKRPIEHHNFSNFTDEHSIARPWIETDRNLLQGITFTFVNTEDISGFSIDTPTRDSVGCPDAYTITLCNHKYMNIAVV